MRMIPELLLLTSSTVVLAPCWAAVASSWPDIRNSPSPVMVKAVRPLNSGRRDADRHAIPHGAVGERQLGSVAPCQNGVAAAAVQRGRSQGTYSHTTDSHQRVLGGQQQFAQLAQRVRIGPA